MAARYAPVGAAAVTADDLLAVVRVHADRVHDLVRRLGCDPDVAPQVVRTSALDLVDAVATRPDGVPDPVGWWFARARALAAGAAASTPDLPLGGGVLSGDQDQEVLAAALARLPEPQRVVLLLRDAYDLPAESVAAAIGTGPEAALERVGRARLGLLPLVDDEPVAEVPAHQSDLGAVARIGEGGPVAARDATARRHALSCEACRALTDAQQRAHVLLTGLAVVALPAGDRVGVLTSVQSAVSTALPGPVEHLLVSSEQRWDDDEEPRSSRLLLALLLAAVAGLLGAGLGVLLAQTGESTGALPVDAQLLTPPPPAPSPTVSPPTLQFPAPQTTVFVLPPPSPPPAPTPEPTEAPPLEPLAITLDPTSGPDGEPLTVSGTGWTPGVEVRLEYVDPTGRPTESQALVTADADGRFTAELVALDPERLPGPHVVRASDGELTAEAVYDAQP